MVNEFEQKANQNNHPEEPTEEELIYLSLHKGEKPGPDMVKGQTKNLIIRNLVHYYEKYGYVVLEKKYGKASELPPEIPEDDIYDTYKELYEDGRAEWLNKIGFHYYM